MSWNEKCRDASFIDSLKVRDPKAFKPESYLIVGSNIIPEASCALGKFCNLEPSAGKGELVKDTDSEGNDTSRPLVYTWVFCYACNSIFHLHCQDYISSEFRALEFTEPFRCKLCRLEPENPMATEFYAIKDEIDLRIESRRDKFLKVIDLSRDSLPVTKREEIDLIKIDYEKKIQDLTQRVKSAEKQRNEAIDLMIELRREVDELKTFKREYLACNAKDRCEPSTSSTNPRLPPTPRRNVRESISPSIISRHNVDEPLPQHTRRPTKSTAGAVPMPKPRRSFIDEIDVDKLTQSDRITLEQAQAQMEATQAQRVIASTQSLAVIRKALPKITRFDGDPRKWIQFKRDVDRYLTVGKYDEYEMRIHVLQALEGLALSRVQGSIDKVNFKTTMEALQKCFGEPTRIIEQCAKDILAIKIPKYLCKDDVLMITSKIQEYFAACHYADVECANSNQLATHIFDQLSVLHKQLFRHKFRTSTNSYAFRLIELDILFEFLEDLADDLEDKKLDERKSEEKKAKPMQINMNAMDVQPSNSFGISKSSDKYEIEDLNDSPFGYEMKALATFNKSCDCCSLSGHYTVQCRKYKAMSPYERLEFVNSKNICRNCVITSTHRAYNCRLKLACGWQEGEDKCFHKHHISLHKAFGSTEASSYFNKKFSGNGNGNGSSGYGSKRTFQRNNSKFNQHKAENIIKESQCEKNKSTDSEEDTDKRIDFELPVNKSSQKQAPCTVRQCGHTVSAYTANSDSVTAHCNKSKSLANIQRSVKGLRNKLLRTDKVTLLRDKLRKLIELDSFKSELILEIVDVVMKRFYINYLPILMKIDDNPNKIVDMGKIGGVRMANVMLPDKSMRRPRSFRKLAKI